MSDPEFVNRTALGMIRNFPDSAAREAEVLSQRYGRKNDHEASALWLAVARAVRQSQKTPAG